MYYDYPEESRAYSQDHQYMFGSALMVCPVTAPADDATGMGSVKVWIPEGIWTDFFTGKNYEGNRTMVLNRPIEQSPVLASAGAIVPTACHHTGSNDTQNPQEMEVFVFPGASGSYTMYEDDGVSDAHTANKAFFTQFNYDEDTNTFTISGYGDPLCVPASRSYTITFRGFRSFEPEGDCIQKVVYDTKTRSLSVIMKPIAPCQTVTLRLTDAKKAGNQNMEADILDFLTFAKLPIEQKSRVMTMVRKGYTPERILEELQFDGADIRLLEVLAELLY